MKTADIIRRAGRSLRQAKTRTLLTSLAIGVGAFTITLSLAGGQGGRDYADAIVRANTDVNELSVTKAQEESSAVQEYTEGQGRVQSGPFSQGLEAITFEELDKIRAVEGVKQVTPNYSPSVDYITADGEKKFIASLSTFSPSVAIEFAAGGSDGDLANDEIILTEDYVEALGFGSANDAVGKTVTIRATRLATSLLPQPETKDFTYTVAGVSSESGLAFRAQGSLLISADASEALYTYASEDTPTYGKFLLASVLVNDPEQAETVKEKLVADGYDAQTAQDVLGVINTFINVLLGVLLGFGALAVITSIFGIVNTQYISVLERTQQIGLMKALGMSQADVGKLFTFEAAWIGFLGGIIGSGLAVIGGSIANPIISDALGIGDIYLLIFSPWQVAIVVISLILISIVAGILPARKASKLDPIEALRTE